MCEEYNGWSNKPTWLFSLWLSDDPAFQELMRDKAKSDSKKAEALRDMISEWAQSVTISASFFSDLISWAIAMIDYSQIIKMHKNDYV